MTLAPRTLNLLTWAAVVGAVIAVALLLGAGPGHRFGLWHFRVSFDLMRWAAYLGLGAAIAAVVVAALRVRQRRPIVWCLIAVVLGLTSAWVPWQQLRAARSVPPIHDITTDTADPPAFVALPVHRPADANPLDYGGPELAAQQRAAYPDVAPLDLPVPLRDAWARAVAAAHVMGWRIVAEDPEAGHLKATATTFWFGFVDDVVVRVRALEGGGSRVDVRSVSRIGKSDLGANAGRIKRYLDEVRAS